MENQALHRKRKSKSPTVLIFICLFVFFAFISYFAPLTGDDWTWGTSLGMDRLENWFHDYNGRYFSNLLIIVMTRIAWLKVAIMALSSTLLIMLIGSITKKGKKDNLPYYLAFTLIMLVPLPIFKQTFGWTSGYINYVTSMVFLFAFLLVVKNIFDDKPPKYSKYQVILVSPLAFLTQLIVEHMTIFVIATGMFVILYTYYKHRRFYLLHWVYLISSLIGAVVMFTNTAYLNVLLGRDVHDYRTVEAEAEGGMLLNMYETYRDVIHQSVFIDNAFMLFIISILVVVLIMKTDTGKQWLDMFVRPVLIAIITGYNLLSNTVQKSTTSKKNCLTYELPGPHRSIKPRYH